MINFSDVYNFLQQIEPTNNFNIIDYIDENKNQLLTISKNKTNGTIFYNPTAYLDNIFESYNYSEDKLWKQVNHDIPRMQVYYDGFKINNSIHLQSFTNNIEVAMLCTQAALFLPFSLLNNLFTNIDENIYLMNDPLNRKVNIIQDNVTIECTLKLFDVTNTQVINYISVKLIHKDNVIIYSLY